MRPLKFTVEYTPPYSLQYHAEGGYAERSFWIDDRPVVLRLRQSAPDEAVYAEAYSDAALGRIADRVHAAARRMIAAPDDLGQFRAAMERDKRMLRLIDALHGLKPMRVPDLWTTLIRSVSAQQISVAAARSIREKLARRFGTVIRVDGADVSVVPAPHALVGMTDADFAAVGFSRRKGEYVRGIAEAFLNGTIRPDQIEAMPAEEMIRTLSALRGIGVWTAECTGIFCLEHRDLLPADDLGVQKSITELYRLKADPRPKEVIERGKKWAGWRTYVSVYLWGARNHKVFPLGRAEGSGAR